MAKRIEANGWGRIWVSNRFDPYPGEPWGIDSGAYRDWTHGSTTDWGRYKARCERALDVGGLYMAVLPDLVAQGDRSLDFSLELPQAMNYPLDLPWYLALQDGMTSKAVTNAVEASPHIEGLFLGGTLRFKGMAEYWKGVADDLGRRFHYGRCGIPRRIVHALHIGCDSCDSAFPLWNFHRIDQVELALRNELAQIELIFR